MYITHNNTLALTQPIAKGKEYTHHCNGKTLTDFNHELIIYHKRNFKTIEWKDLGPKMSVIYTKETLATTPKLNPDTLQWCLTWFQGFDEELNQKYFFLHDVDEETIEKLNSETQIVLGIAEAIYDGSQHRITQDIEQPTPKNNLETAISVLYFVSMLYGRWDVRTIQEEEHVRSITIQLPILSQNTYLLSRFEKMHHNLQALGYFNTHSVVENEDGYIIQYTITDEEILSMITSFDLAKTYVITKKHSTDELKTRFLDHCKEQGFDASTIQDSYLKFLPKNK